ncbi:MAG: isopentenyl phosphate kinase [Thermoplasmatota archaeon]
MFLVKLGGSIITDKAKKYTFKTDIMDNLSKQIQQSKKQIILVHGAGSFGHILAKQYNLQQGFKENKQLIGFSETHAKVQQLNSLVLDSLHHHNIAAVSLPPHAFLTLDNHQPHQINYTFFTDYLQKGFTPVTFGDVVLDKTLCFSICSGDLLMLLLAKQFKPEKVIFVLDEDGIYTENPKQNPQATLIKQATLKQLEYLSTNADAHADVTKGMQGKIETIKHIATLGIDTLVVNGNINNRLGDILNEKKTISTHVYGERQ